MTQSYVVIGAYGGIGETLCRRLVQGGAHVPMAGRDAGGWRTWRPTSAGRLSRWMRTDLTRTPLTAKLRQNDLVAKASAGMHALGRLGAHSRQSRVQPRAMGGRSAGEMRQW